MPPIIILMPHARTRSTPTGRTGRTHQGHSGHGQGMEGGL